MNDADLKNVLDQFGSNSPDMPIIRWQEAINRIERRRRRNAAILTTTSIAAGLVAVTGALFAGAYLFSDSDRSTSETNTDRETVGGVAFAECGGTVHGNPAPTSPLTFAFRGPERAAPDPRGFAVFDVAVANRSQSPITGITGNGPEVFVTKNRTVVALPSARRAVGIPFDLAPGATMTLQAAANLTPCDRSAPALPPGSYEVFVRQRISIVDANRLATGETIEVHGGPWLISVT